MLNKISSTIVCELILVRQSQHQADAMDADEAFNQYKLIFKYIGFFGGLAGVNLTRSGYKANWCTYFWISVNSSIFLSTFYTLCFYDEETAWKNLAVLGLTMQVNTSKNN